MKLPRANQARAAGAEASSRARPRLSTRRRFWHVCTSGMKQTGPQHIMKPRRSTWMSAASGAVASLYAERFAPSRSSSVESALRSSRLLLGIALGSGVARHHQRRDAQRPRAGRAAQPLRVGHRVERRSARKLLHAPDPSTQPPNPQKTPRGRNSGGTFFSQTPVEIEIEIEIEIER